MRHIISAFLLLLAISAHASQSATSGVDIVARHAITLNAPAGGPTKFMARGPLLGNEVSKGDWNHAFTFKTKPGETLELGPGDAR